MNRAFVKESDLEQPQPLPERTHSDLPNYITAAGVATLEELSADLRTKIDALKTSEQLEARSQRVQAQQDLRYYEERLRRAIIVDPPQTNARVMFGHTVLLLDGDGNEYTFTLVGEDEIDVDAGRISWAAPIAKLLTGRVVGDEVEWPRGDRKLRVEIADIS